MNKYYVYKITNLVNKKVYVGKTRDIDERWKRHIYISDSGESDKSYSYLHRAINKYKKENFKIELIDSFDDENSAYNLEKVWIEAYESNNNNFGYNLNEGGKGGKSPSKETRDKISISRQGNKHPMFGKKGELSPSFGIKRNEETIKKLKESKKGNALGEDNPKSKLLLENVCEIRALCKDKILTRKQIAAQYNISKATIDAIASKRNWGHVQDEKIGIVGSEGFVGNAVKEAMSRYFRVETYDKKEGATCKSLSELCKKSDIIFVCVPTPMKKNGACDTSIVKTIIENISVLDSKKLVVIKSTIPPGTTQALAKDYDMSNLVFNPEFLVEKTAKEDFENQDRIVLGGDKDSVERVANYYKVLYDCFIVETTATTAEMVKYVTNSFLSTKVAFFNEIYQICNKLELNYKEVRALVHLDKRIGKSHTVVPGPDGKFGFGGSCFPKDLNALIAATETLEGDCPLLKAVWSKNLEVRPERDWEDLKGRAVVDENLESGEK